MENLPSAEWLAATSVAAVLRTGDGKQAVEAAYDEVVKCAFARLGPSASIPKDAVTAFVGENVVELPDEEIGGAVDRLLESRQLLSVPVGGKDCLSLAMDTYALLQSQQEDLMAKKTKAFDGWLKRECELNPQVQEHQEELTKLMEEHIGKVIGYIIAEVKADWQSSEGIPHMEPPVVDHELLKGKSPAIQSVGKDACERFFKEAAGDRRQYLEALVDGYYELQLLRCTPEIQDVFTAQLTDTECFLDTNVLLDVIGVNAEPSQVELARHVVSKSVDCGVAVSVSEETRAEYLRLLDDADRQRFGVLHRIERGGHTEDGINASPFLLDYLSRLRSNRQLTWSEYKTEHENLPTLLKPRGIRYAQNAWIKNREEIDPVAGIFDYCWKSKRPKAREHDAAMYLLIREFRRQKNSGLRAWFMTRDYTLSVFDKEAGRRLPALEFATPSFSVRPHSWLEWLRSRTPGSTAPGIVHLLCDLRFTRVTRDYRVVARQIEYMETYRDLDPDLIQSLDCVRMIEDELGKLSKPSDASDEVVLSIVDKAVLTNAERLKSEGMIAKEEVESLAQQILELQSALGERDARHDHLEAQVREMGETQAEEAKKAERLADENRCLQRRNQLIVSYVMSVAVGIALLVSVGLVASVGSWWIPFVLFGVPLIQTALKLKKGEKPRVRLAVTPLLSIAPTLLACVLIGVEAAMSSHLPKTWQPIARNEALWIIGSLGAGGQVLVGPWVQRIRERNIDN